MAAIEVKSTLTTQHLEAALSQFRKIKALHRDNKIQSKGGMHTLEKTPCILFAFNGPTLETLTKNIFDFGVTHNLSVQDYAPDLAVVLTKDYYLCKDDGWIFPIETGHPSAYRHWVGLPHENLVGLYTYLHHLCLSYLEFSTPVQLAPYFDKSILTQSD